MHVTYVRGVLGPTGTMQAHCTVHHVVQLRSHGQAGVHGPIYHVKERLSLNTTPNFEGQALQPTQVAGQYKSALCMQLLCPSRQLL